MYLKLILFAVSEIFSASISNHWLKNQKFCSMSPFLFIVTNVTLDNEIDKINNVIAKRVHFDCGNVFGLIFYIYTLLIFHLCIS